MRLILLAIGVLAAGASVYLAADLTNLSHWVVDQQRVFQNRMASAVHAIRAGDAGAQIALFSATGAYGFVHALGPGHGKYLVGGVGLGTSVSATKLLSIAAISSLVQAAWAILLVYGGFALLEASAQQMTFLAEEILAPASYLAIGTVGGILVWRGLRSLPWALKPKTHLATAHHAHHHDDGCGCGHSHGPTRDEIARVGSFKDAIGLIASIAVRPCTGAIFLLVIAWQMEIKQAGAIAVMIMGLGTAMLTSIVALSSVAARALALASTGRFGATSTALLIGQVLVGTGVLWISLWLLANTL